MRNYLQKTVSPLLSRSSELYKHANRRSSQVLSKYGNKLPSFVTANAITTCRTALIVPTLFLVSNDYSLLPAALVVTNVSFDYVDGAVARWERTDPVRRKTLDEKSRAPVGSVYSARTERLNATWGAYYDAIADKFFAIPLWMCCFQAASGDYLLQSLLLTHTAIETGSSYIRTKAYFNEPSPVISTPSSPKEQAFSSSAVVAGSAGKAKQALSMLGTALILLPSMEPVGTALLGVSVPLALLSVQQKLKPTVVYAEISSKHVTAEHINFLEQARATGTSLVVGYRTEGSTTISLNDNSYDDAKEGPDENLKLVQLLGCVDRVIVDKLPGQIDENFLNRFNIDRVVVPSSATIDRTKSVCPGLMDKGLVNSVP